MSDSNSYYVPHETKWPFLNTVALVVLFIGLAFGFKIGLATVSLYLLEGIFGLPVFANSPEKGVGLIYFTGPTMGYLIGFLVAVYFTVIFKNLFSLINDKGLNLLIIFFWLTFKFDYDICSAANYKRSSFFIL